MKFIQGNNRTQINLFPVSLDRSIDPDNEVRIIDLFVESLSIKDYGFRTDFTENGRPAYHPTDLLKLFIYGYLNKVRSSRDLEKECGRNIELMWLLKCLKPDHNTISNFRRDNPQAIKKVFRTTVQIARHFDLIGGKLIAGDSTKLRAQNSKKNNFNQAKINRHVAYIDNKLEVYTRSLAENDGDNRQQIEDEIDKLDERKTAYRELEDKLKESGESQISLSDPESRQIMVRNNITEVSYNIQSTVDSKHNIPIGYKVTNENDSKAMGNMVQRVKSILGTSDFTVLYDKGFHTGSELKTAQDLGVETIVAIPDVASTSQAPPIPCSTTSSSDTTRRMIPIHARADRYCEPMDRGTSSGQAVVVSAGLNNTRLRHAGNVPHGHSAPDRRRKGSFSEANMQIITRLTGSTLKKRESSTKDDRQ